MFGCIQLLRPLVLCSQGYIVAFHSGGILVHHRVGHHPAAAVGPGVFVLLGFLVAWLQTNLLTALEMTVMCGFLGVMLGLQLVKSKDAAVGLLEVQWAGESTNHPALFRKLQVYMRCMSHPSLRASEDEKLVMTSWTDLAFRWELARQDWMQNLMVMPVCRWDGTRELERNNLEEDQKVGALHRSVCISLADMPNKNNKLGTFADETLQVIENLRN